MEIQHQQHGKRGAFFIEQDGDWIAEMTYVSTGDGEITIDHTEIDESLRGKGVGYDLIEEVVKYARTEKLKIKATCPFAKKILDKSDDYEDVLA